MEEFSEDMTVEKAWDLLRKTQYLSDLDWDVEFPESPEKDTHQKTSAIEKKKEKTITPHEGCSSHSLLPEVSDHMAQKEASNMDETDTARHSASIMESRVFIQQANILVKEETDYIEIKEEPITLPSSESETLHEDTKKSAVNEMKKEKTETSHAGCCSHSLQPDIVEPLLRRITSTSDETDSRRSSASEMESRVSLHQTNFVVKEEPDCIEVKEEPLSPLASSISCEEPVKNETHDGDIQVSSVSPMKKELETTSFSSFHCDAVSELSPDTESGSVIAETPRPVMTQTDSSKKGNRGTYIECSTACTLQIASSSSQPLLAEAVGMSTQEHSSVLLQNVDCQTPFAMASCSTAMGGYLLQRHIKEEVAEERQARRRAGSRREREGTCNSGRRSERGLSNEISLPEREMEKAPSLRSSCEESVWESNGKAFECSTCKKQFPSKILLYKHMRRHTGEICYMCSHCEKSFSQRGNLTRHMRIPSGEKSYKCSQYEKAFSNSGALDLHMQIPTGDKPYQCSKCEKSLNNSGTLTKHMRNHAGKKPFRCSHCEKSFRQRGHLLIHMRIHSGEKPYQCSQCEKSFSQRAHLNQHMRIHSGEKPYRCSQCEKSFSQRAHLNQHMRIHSGEKPYQCSQCEKSFSQRGSLIQHMRIHSGEKPHQCTQCEKSFSQRGQLITHMHIHSGEKPYQCSQCEKSFNNSGTLTKHMRNHTGKKPFRCIHCEKSFRQRGTLVIHMSIHSGEKPYKCSQCKKSFSNRDNLTKHMHIHTGKKPFKCSQCEKSFSHKATLIQHMRIHSGEKPYQCSQCEKSFSQRGHLIMHMHIHSGEKPYQCSQCEKSFNNSGTLTKHMHIHTGKKPFKCSHCDKSFSSRSNLTGHMRIHK